MGLSFVNYEIIGSTENEIDVIKKLESWFFEVPPTKRTAGPRQVKRWHKEWIKGELFVDIPTDGLAVKVGSGATKQNLVLIQLHKMGGWLLSNKPRPQLLLKDF